MRTLLTAAVAISLACSRAPRVATTLRGCPAPTATDYYFQRSAFVKEHLDADEFERGWYSKHLRAMAEPSLSCGTVEDDLYRFTWLRTFHHPVSVRVIRRGSDASLVALELTGAGGYQPGEVLHRVQKRLSPSDWNAITESVAQAGFWRMPTKPTERDAGADGAQWIVEGRRPAGYHIVVRWTPHDGEFRALGLTLIGLAGLRIPPDEVY